MQLKNQLEKYIAFCDDDDNWVKDKLKIQLEIFKKHNVIAVGSLTKPFGDLSLTRKVNRNSKSKKGLIKFKDILNFNSCALSSLIYKNNGLLFKEDKKYITVEDLLFNYGTNF